VIHTGLPPSWFQPYLANIHNQGFPISTLDGALASSHPV
jgi:hypothetical protein